MRQLESISMVLLQLQSPLIIKYQYNIYYMIDKDHQQGECFEAVQSLQEIQQISPQSLSIVGQANPIYSKKKIQGQQDYDAPIAFKILPILQNQDIINYAPFRLKQQKQLQRRRKIRQSGFQQSQEEQQQSPQAVQVKCSLQNPFTKFYQEISLVYCKFDNTKHNKFKQIQYFSGVFIPKEILSQKLRNRDYEGKIQCGLQKILKKAQKQKDALFLTADNSKLSQDKIKNGRNQNIYQRKIHTKLIFDSHFESGNLFACFRVGKFQYDLVLCNDINSKGSTQWFYFSVEGMLANTDYTFNIINFTKNDSLFNYGMKPAFYSVHENNGMNPFENQSEYTQNNLKNQKTGWYRFGTDVKYYKGQIQRQNSKNFYYILSFTINIKHSGDKVYLAHSYPYTYSRMVNLMKYTVLKFDTKNKQPFQTLNKKQTKKIKNFCAIMEQITIGKSVANRELIAYLVSNKQEIRKTAPKQAIIIMARQHPGQTQGSYVIQGVVNKLSEAIPSKEIKFLLQNYNVYLIPMVNPDGVVFGNYRTNLCGKDLNRKWDTIESSNSNSSTTPQISCIKQFILNLSSQNTKIRFVLDLHGHSKKLNSFFYGNPCPQSPQLVKIFPYICSRYSQAIQFMDCTFVAQKYKKKAARVYLSSYYKQIHVYTFQCSFFGYSSKQRCIKQFTPAQLMKLGKVLINSLYLMLLKDKQKMLQLNSVNQIGHIQQNKNSNFVPEVKSHESALNVYKKFQNELKQNRLLLEIGDKQSSGSESKPQQAQLNVQLIKYVSDEQQKDSRIYVNKNGADDPQKDIQSRTKSLKIDNKKRPLQNTIEYKDISRQFRNKKLATISQVNAVLPDKYHISLLPIERVAYKTGKKNDCYSQTQPQQKLFIRLYKTFQIEQKLNLAGIYNNQQAERNQSINGSTVPSLNKNQSKLSQPKKHSQIIAEIEKNSKHQIYREHFKSEKNAFTRKNISQIQSLKCSINNRETNNKKYKQTFTQTIVTFKASNQSKIIKPLSTKLQGGVVINKKLSINSASSIISSSAASDIKNEYQLTQNQIRIAKMQQINKQVLKIYSKKSVAIQLHLKSKTDKIPQKIQQKQSKYSKLQEIGPRKI